MINLVIIQNRFNMNILANGLHNSIAWPTPWNLISIHSDKEGVSGPLNSSRLYSFGMNKCLSLRFADVTGDEPFLHELKRLGRECVVFNEHHASAVVLFVDAIQDSPIKQTLVVHCDAGFSRSGAVGTYAALRCGIALDRFNSVNPFLSPNVHVLATLKRVSGMVPIGS